MVYYLQALIISVPWGKKKVPWDETNRKYYIPLACCLLNNLVLIIFFLGGSYCNAVKRRENKNIYYTNDKNLVMTRRSEIMVSMVPNHGFNGFLGQRYGLYCHFQY